MIHFVLFLLLCSRVIEETNIKQKTLRVYYFLIKQKKLFGQPTSFLPDTEEYYVRLILTNE